MNLDPAIINAKLIIGNSNKRFSGITSTMLQILPYQSKIMPLAVLGKHHLPEGVPSLNYRQLIQVCKSPLPNGKPRIFHARRNDEMIQAIIAKKYFGAKLKIVFTSTAQRHHSRFTRWLMSEMDGIVTTCSATAAYLKQPADIIIPHGIDIALYTPAAALNQATNNPLKIGVFGRVRPSKGIDLLIDAAIPVLKDRPNVKLIVCGETTPKYQNFLEEQQHKINTAGVTEQVEFLGKVSFAELPDLYRSMSLVCAVSRNEGYGITPLEAMASGVPVLTSEAGAWLDMVENGVHGYSTPTGDTAAIEAKLRLMLSDPAKLKTMGIAGRQHVEQHYTNEHEAQQLCEFFQLVLESNN